MYFALEESAAQICRNMRSIGLDLDGCITKGLLKIQAARPTVFGLEMHLVAIHKLIEEFQPRAIVVDPISSLITAGNLTEVKSMLVRLFDYLKMKQITCLVTRWPPRQATRRPRSASRRSSHLVSGPRHEISVSGRAPLPRQVARHGALEPGPEFLITSHGVDLIPVAVGPNGVLTGSARIDQETEQRAQALARQHEIERKQRALLRKSKMLDNQIEAMRAELAAEEEEATSLAKELVEREQRQAASRLSGEEPCAPRTGRGSDERDPERRRPRGAEGGEPSISLRLYSRPTPKALQAFATSSDRGPPSRRYRIEVAI